MMSLSLWCLIRALGNLMQQYKNFLRPSWNENRHGTTEFENYIYRRANFMKHHFVLHINGERGNGKSWTALRLARNLDPSFTADRIVFSPKQFMDLVLHGN